MCHESLIYRSAGNEIVRLIFTARITSNFSFKYGRVEIRAQFPRGNWNFSGNIFIIILPQFTGYC